MALCSSQHQTMSIQNANVGEERERDREREKDEKNERKTFVNPISPRNF